MTNCSKSITVVIPIYNEEKNIDELSKRLIYSLQKISISFEILFVIDGSTDNSLLKIKKLTNSYCFVKYLSLSRNFGHQIAITAGLDHACGDIVVIIDADLQDPPELIPKLYEEYQKGYNVVYAKRKLRRGESRFKKISAMFFYRMLKSITTFEFPLDTGDYRLIDNKVVKILRQMPEQNKFLRGQIAWIGLRSTYVEYEREERKHGQSSYSPLKMLDLALDGITSLSNRPLHLVTQVGFTVAFLSLFLLTYALWSHFVWEQTIDGWTSLIITTAFLGGVQLFSLGIIGEYISRINRNVLNRPLYLVEESNFQKR